MFPTLSQARSASKNKPSPGNFNERLWQSSARSHVGMVREINEDSVFANSETCIWAVADGMGGHEAGDVASQMIVHALENNFSRLVKKPRLSHIVEQLDDELQLVNRRIQQHSEMILQGETLGSTLVLLTILGEVGICLWAGDSRLYRYRDNKLEKITRDHSKVEELIDAGVLSADQAVNHPESNVITRAVGAFSELFIDHSAFLIEPDDEFLLCSDGLYNCLEHAEMEYFMRQDDINQRTEEMIARTLEKNARDNVSVVVVRSA